MCTVSWTAERGGYELFFNRDELNTRAPERPPVVAQRDGVEFLAPRDGDRDGTWLLVNECGVTVCLLNDYGHPWRPAGDALGYSRGHVVLACAAAASHEAAIEAVRMQPLERVLPFQLLVLSPSEGALALKWQGRQLVPSAPEMLAPPLTSSSLATDVVVATRVWTFSETVRCALAATPAELSAYHRRHVRAAGAASVLMRRPDASTRSISHVRVTGRSVHLAYQPVRWAMRGPVMLKPTRVMLARRGTMTLAA
jgi:hypothetical protein